MELSDLPTGYTYIQESNDGETFLFRIREVIDESSAMAWLGDFSDHTRTTWRKARTYPYSGKQNVYKVMMRCVHNTDRRVTGQRFSKNTGCRACMTITIKRFVKHSKRIPDAKIVEFPTIVYLKTVHNHELDSAAALFHRDIAPEVTEKLLQLFLLGHSPASALHCHKSDLLLQHGENYFKVIEDGKFLPSYSKVFHLFKKEFKGEEISDKRVLKNLAQQVEKYENDTGGIAKFKRTTDGSHYFVVICTPIMIRAHEMLSQSSELVMVDASGDIVGEEKHRVYFFVSPCLAGGIPLGIIITDAKTEEVFSEALDCFKASLPPTAFFSKISPSVFMMDNDLTEVSILNKVFPSAEIVLCHFHMLKAMWRWLMDAEQSISQSKRRELFFLFRALLYSGDEATAKENLKNLISCAKQIKYYDLIIYITQLMQQKQMWINYFRASTGGNNTNNYGEIVFSILKDSILKRTMAFNIIQLVDYLVTRYEKYVHTRIMDFCNGQSNSHLMKMMIPFKSSGTLHVDQEGNGNFSVSNEKGDTFTVNFEIGICSCPVGVKGRLCVHASAVILLLDSNITAAYDIVDEKFKGDLFYVAEGRHPPEGWLQPLNDQIESEIEISSCYAVEEYTANENAEPPSNENAEPLSNENAEPLSDENYEPLSNENYEPLSNENAEPPSSVLVLEPTSETNNEIRPLTLEEIERLNSTFFRIQQRLQQGLENDPINYIPAVRNFLCNAEKITNSDSDFLSAMHTFGSKAENHKLMIGPTSLGTTKSSGKELVLVGHLSDSSIDYDRAKQVYDSTTFGYQPSGKRKALHNLQKCVEDNISLSSKKAKL